MNKIHPFLKWVGGKTQLINILEDNLPNSIKETKNIDRYIEPFIGGGSFFIYLKKNYDIKESIISDINPELIITYKTIQKNPLKLIESLHNIKDEYLKKNNKEREIFYYNIRDIYNNNITNINYNKYNSEWITRASYTIFLNKICFNGLYRLNQKSKFNVPIGKYKNPKIFDVDNILNINLLLKDVKILNCDYLKIKKYVCENSLVYFDPPYRPISKTSNFNSYSKNNFNDDSQKILCDFYKELNKINCYLMLSNSDPKNLNYDDNFFDELYSQFNIIRVEANRMINSNTEKRKIKIKELLIKNF